MLEDKEPVVSQNIVGQNEVWDAIHFRQSVGRIGENDVVLHVSRAYEGESVAPDTFDELSHTEVSQGLGDKAEASSVMFDASQMLATSGNKLVGYTARASEEVEDSTVLEVDEVGKDVEKVFLGEISCRSSREGFRRAIASPTKRAADYTHRDIRNKL